MKKSILKYCLPIFSLVFFISCSQTSKEDTKFYGNVDVRTVSLSFRVSGRIKNINFEEGQKVQKGDVITSLESELYQEYINQIDAQIKLQEAKLQKLEKGYRVEEIEKAQATLLQQEVLKQKALKDFKRVEKLFKSDSISSQDFDDAKASYDLANASYMYAKNSLELLKNGYEKEDILEVKAQLLYLKSQKREKEIALKDTNLYAPTNGILLTRVYEEGSIVNASQIVAEVAKEDSFWVRTYMSEKYLGLIKQGMSANITTDSNQNKIYKGKVSFISPLAEFTPKSVQTQELRTDLVYRFRIVLDDVDDKIRQGMPVTITFDDLK